MTFTYTDGVPNPPNNPSADVANMQTNTNSISSIVAVDHIGFNLANGGFHTVIHQGPQGSDPVNVAGFGQTYTKTVGADQQLFYESGAGVINQLTPFFMRIVAYVSFMGQGANGPCVLNYNSSNVLNVTRTGAGLYSVNFSPVLTTANYIPVVIAQPPSNTQTRNSMIDGTTTPTTGTLKLLFQNSGGSNSDPTNAYVAVLSP